MAEFVIELLLAVALTLAIKGGFAVADRWIAWWLAALIAVTVVFGGWFILVDTDGGWG